MSKQKPQARRNNNSTGKSPPRDKETPVRLSVGTKGPSADNADTVHLTKAARQLLVQQDLLYSLQAVIPPCSAVLKTLPKGDGFAVETAALLHVVRTFFYLLESQTD